MSTPYEMFALVEMFQRIPSEPPAIKRVIRTYDSKERAQADLDLLDANDEFRPYAVLTVPHIER